MTKNDLISACCPVCSSTSKFKIIGKPELSPKAELLIKEMYQVLKCQNCRFYFVSPQNLTNVEMSKLYDDTYFTEMTKWWARKRDRDRKSRLDKLQECLNQKRIRFLDMDEGRKPLELTGIVDNAHSFVRESKDFYQFRSRILHLLEKISNLTSLRQECNTIKK